MTRPTSGYEFFFPALIMGINEHSSQWHSSSQLVCFRRTKQWLHLNPPVVISVDWTLFGKAHTYLDKVLRLTVHVGAQNKHEVKKELSVGLRDKISSRHKSGEWYRKLNGRCLEPPGLFLEPASSLKIREVTNGKEPNGHSAGAPALFCGERRTFQKDNHLCRNSPIGPGR